MGLEVKQMGSQWIVHAVCSFGRQVNLISAGVQHGVCIQASKSPCAAWSNGKWYTKLYSWSFQLAEQAHVKICQHTYQTDR